MSRYSHPLDTITRHVTDPTKRDLFMDMLFTPHQWEVFGL